MIRRRKPIVKSNVKKKRLVFYAWIAGLVVVLVLLALFAFFYNKKIQIKEIAVIETGSIQSESLIEIVQKEINRKYLLLFPKKNIFLFPKKAIRNEIHRNFPRAKRVVFDRDFPQTLGVGVREQEAKFLWCGDGQCYFANENGFVFAKAPKISGDTLPVFLSTLLEKKNQEFTYGYPIGRFVVSRSGLDKINTVISVLDKLGIIAKNIKILDENIITLVARNDLKLHFDISAPVAKLAENLDLVLKSDVIEASAAKGFSDLDYIDMRFGNKVFYKFK